MTNSTKKTKNPNPTTPTPNNTKLPKSVTPTTSKPDPTTLNPINPTTLNPINPATPTPKTNASKAKKQTSREASRAKKKAATTKKLFLFDRSYGLVLAGCDEAGRGSLAGPVVCAACIMPLAKMIEGINDSKQIGESDRELLYERITSEAIAYSVSVIDCEVIDRINILQASKLGMANAINDLSTKPDLVLVDAVSGLATNLECEAIIKGDQKSYNIAAASILAKVTRDRIMRKLADDYPEYGFLSNKGYATRVHIEALKKHGATKIHRKLFVRNALTEQLQFDLDI